MSRDCFVANDQYGESYYLGEHPRKELMDYFGVKHADKMYTELKDGSSYHAGYIISGHWLTVLGLEGRVFARNK